MTGVQTCALPICERTGVKHPKFYYVNWFRKDKNGKFLWPGYGENSRVLKWIFERCEGSGKAEESAIGYIPAKGAIDTSGLKISAEAMEELMTVNTNEWLTDIPGIRVFFGSFEDFPEQLAERLDWLEKRLKA